LLLDSGGARAQNRRQASAAEIRSLIVAERLIVQELVPISCGFLLGTLLGGSRPSLQRTLGTLLAVALGVMATLVTGEAAISWMFVAIDVPIVAAAALLGRFVGRRLRPMVGRAPLEEP
jgi:hypothetical protein